MTTPTSHALLRLSALGAALGAAALLSACVVEAPPRYVQRPVPVYQQPAPVYQQPAPAYVQEDEPVVSVYVDPPIDQPAPIAVQWAPPPMLVEVPPPQPYGEAVWTGGYWAWEGRWFWSAGRWAPPPRPSYLWVQPYYEHRADVVVFVPGFWCAPERHFVPPAPGLSISIALAAPGVRMGRPPMGPQGIFVPPPPGSRAGIIVPAPLGTAPAVVVSAPAVVNVGMRVRGNVDVNSHNTTNNVTNITNVTNVTIEAPAGATANGQAFQNSVPARAHLAAALAPAGRPAAPQPTSQQAIPSYQSGHQPTQLPTAQPVRNERFDRNNAQNGGGRVAPPQNAGGQPPQGQQPMPQQGQPRPGQGQAQGQGQGRPEFDQPPRQPAQVNGQPLPPQGGQRQGNGQPLPPQGGQPQGQAPQAQGQPQPANPQDPRRRGGNGQGQGQGQGQQGQPGGQPAAQPAAQPASQGQPQARKDARNPREKEERKKTEHERPEDRKKDNGERDR